jgi:hypothetical protein
MVTMNVWQQQKLDDLRVRFADRLAHRDQLAAQRQAHADALAPSLVAGINEQIRRLDDEIAEHCRSIADIERALRATP